LDFYLDPAVDAAAAERGYTPLSTGLLFGVFYLPPDVYMRSFTRKEKQGVSNASGGNL
jgi:hypothetical protein